MVQSLPSTPKLNITMESQFLNMMKLCAYSSTTDGCSQHLQWPVVPNKCANLPLSIGNQSSIKKKKNTHTCTSTYTNYMYSCMFQRCTSLLGLMYFYTLVLFVIANNHTRFIPPNEQQCTRWDFLSHTHAHTHTHTHTHICSIKYLEVLIVELKSTQNKLCPYTYI